MVSLGNFLFHYRNGLFPVAYLLLFIPSRPLLPNMMLAFILGLALALLGQLIRFYSIGLVYIVRGGRKRRVYAENLVTDGLFAHCRNPLYLGNILILFGLGIAANSALFTLVGGSFFLLAYHAIIRAEENFLSGKFGSSYQAYCVAVPRYIPKLSGLRDTLKSYRFNWKRVLIKEYGSTFIWVAGLLVILLVRDFRQYGMQHAVPLFTALTLAAVCYAVARFLKKSGIVSAT